MSGKPFEGIRIIDFTIALAGPYSTAMLGDLGAEIIKVENTVSKDRGGPASVNGIGYFFANANHGKKSVTINMKTQAGKELFASLVKTADVMVENFRPGVLERLGFGYESCRELNPGIIYGSVSGFGHTSDFADYPGYDIVGAAMGGGLCETGEPGREPVVPGIPYCDVLTGTNMAVAIMAALLKREKTGRGCYLDVSLVDSMVAAQGYKIPAAAMGFPWQGLTGNRVNRVGGPYDSYRAADGAFVIECRTQREFEGLAKAMGMPELSEDPRFASPEARQKAAAEGDPLKSILSQWAAGKTVREILTCLTSFEVPVSKVRDFREMYSCRQIHEARNMFVQAPFSDGSTATLHGTPVKLSDTPGSVEHCVAFHGENNKEIFRALGYSEEQLIKLKEDGVIA